MTPAISCAFDSGAIDVQTIQVKDAAAGITVRIRRDSQADFRQWFHFRLSGARGFACTLRFENAGACTYPDGWKDYRAVASYDREHWFRVPTTYDGAVMTIAHTPERDAIWYAYFEPYSWERHQALIGFACTSALARVVRLGGTIEGRDLDLVIVEGKAARISTPTLTPGAHPERELKTIWIIARQHPGESMAEWFIEGLMKRLLDPADPMSRRLLERAVVYIVPNMNPDGSVLGNLRTNAAGANLNREWAEPSLKSSPEVFLVRERIQQTGVDVFLDVHGDEALPYVFVAGGEMLPGFTPAQTAAQQDFIADFKRASPDFQDSHGYGTGKYRAEALKLASKWVGHTFGCLSLTLEMPFKDNANLPDATHGWSGDRSARLGAAILEPLLAAVSRDMD